LYIHTTSIAVDFILTTKTYVISGLRCEVDEKCAVLGYYAASSGNTLPTFRNTLSVPSSRVKNPRR